jgi:transposase
MGRGDCAAAGPGEALKVAGGERGRPFDDELVVLTKTEHVALKSEIAYWRGLHAQAAAGLLRERLENQRLRAQVRELQQRVYGQKSEGRARPESGAAKPAERGKRGQRRGSVGHGRTQREPLEERRETVELPPGEARCASCGLPFAEFPGTEDSLIHEVEVRAYTRRVCRKRYRRTCQCASTPGIVAAPRAARLVPKSSLGVSVWARVLLDKYLHGIPLQRICARLADTGLAVAPGTVVGGLRRLLPLFAPVQAELLQMQLADRLVHADETRWPVFALIAGKGNYRWQVWVVQSASVIYYRVAPSRAAKVLVPYCHALQRKGVSYLILVCDRYSAYRALRNRFPFLVLALCWVHVRRDFITLSRSQPALAPWCDPWVQKIAELYQLHDRRRALWSPGVPLEWQTEEFTAAHQALGQALDRMAEERDRQLQEKGLAQAQKTVLASMSRHWAGLTVVRNHPQVPLDNNRAERAIRPVAVARKSYYGSGSPWSGQLLARLLSVFHTLRSWGVNCEHWLQEYLTACAENGGNVPADLRPFLPWEMGPARHHVLARPPAGVPPPRDTS